MLSRAISCSTPKPSRKMDTYFCLSRDTGLGSSLLPDDDDQPCLDVDCVTPIREINPANTPVTPHHVRRVIRQSQDMEEGESQLFVPFNETWDFVDAMGFAGHVDHVRCSSERESTSLPPPSLNASFEVCNLEFDDSETCEMIELPLKPFRPEMNKLVNALENVFTLQFQSEQRVDIVDILEELYKSTWMDKTLERLLEDQTPDQLAKIFEDALYMLVECARISRDQPTKNSDIENVIVKLEAKGFSDGFISGFLSSLFFQYQTACSLWYLDVYIPFSSQKEFGYRAADQIHAGNPVLSLPRRFVTSWFWIPL